ncbi:uncharacterized protein IUM83_05621 [Phytophthora cinnamomi]|uniref:uncharacterized protein n=1 Tax=Phytophthora cinnamomi TaxID=4785 RepID=UPI00355A123A|nr:hypothetical protein IUM83_05621 [Phytophthora cinnamomi]
MVGRWILLHGPQFRIRLTQSPLGAIQAALDEAQVLGEVVSVLLHGLALFLKILDLGFGQIHLGSETLVIFFQVGPGTCSPIKVSLEVLDVACLVDDLDLESLDPVVLPGGGIH